MRILTARSRILVTVLLLISAVAAPAWAQTARESPPPAGTARNFTLPKPTRFTLPNGLAVTLVPFGQVPKVAIRLVVDAGNLYEGADQVWLADLTGRMLEEGTKARAAAKPLPTLKLGRHSIPAMWRTRCDTPLRSR